MPFLIDIKKRIKWLVFFILQSSFFNPIQSNPIQSTFVKRHQSSCLFRGASQKHRGKPLLLTISVLGSFTCITQHTGPTALRPGRNNYGQVSCSRTQVPLPGIEPTFWFSDNTRTWVRCTRPLGHDTPLHSTFFSTTRPLASSDAMSYYRPAPGQTDSIPDRREIKGLVTMDINPSLQFLGWYVKGTGLG